MGLIAHFIIEARVGERWMVCPDLYTPRHNPHEIELNYLTLGHNGLLEAHLLDWFDVMDPGDAPPNLDSDLRIKPWDDLPKDFDSVTASILKEQCNPEMPQPSCVPLQAILDFDWTRMLHHRFWVNGPMMLDWLDQDPALLTLPPRYETAYSTAPGPPQNDKWSEQVSENDLRTVIALCEKKVQGPGLIRPDTLAGGRQAMAEIVEAAAGFRWALFDRQVPLLVTCERFLGRVVGQMLRGGRPEQVRLVSYVT